MCFGKVGEPMQMWVHINLFRKGDHVQPIMRTAKVRVLGAEQVLVQFEAEETEHALQTCPVQRIVPVRRQINGVREVSHRPIDEAVSTSFGGGGANKRAVHAHMIQHS